MRARYVFESIRFERGMDPKKALGIGTWSAIKNDFKADQSWRDYSHEEALSWAARKGIMEYAEFLVANGIDPNYNEGEPLSNAVDNKHKDMVRFLLDNGTKKEYLGNSLDSRNMTLEILEMLINAGVKITDELLESMIWRGTPEILEYLFANGAKIKDHRDIQGTLEYNSDAGMLKVFLDNGLKLDTSGNRYLIKAADDGNVELTKMLLGLGFDGSGQSGGAALISAASSGADEGLETAQVLIDAGADLNTTDEDRSYYVERYSALTRAAEYGRTDIVKLLLDSGADIHILNDKAHKIARKNHRTETLELIKDYKKQGRVRARELAKQNK